MDIVCRLKHVKAIFCRHKMLRFRLHDGTKPRISSFCSHFVQFCLVSGRLFRWCCFLGGWFDFLAIRYSLPGSCPSLSYLHKSSDEVTWFFAPKLSEVIRVVWSTGVVLFSQRIGLFFLKKRIHSLRLTAFAPENRPSQKETIVFQPSIFRCYVSFREGNKNVWTCHVMLFSLRHANFKSLVVNVLVFLLEQVIVPWHCAKQTSFWKLSNRNSSPSSTAKGW